MPSKQTQNYQLSQWVKTDKVLMDDFNADNAAIDAAIKAVDVRVDGKADVSALNDLKKTVDTLSGTVSGHTGSLNSHASALEKVGSCGFFTTTCPGDGASVKTLTFPNYPMYVFIQPLGYNGGITFTRIGGCGSGNYGSTWAIPTWTNRELSWQMEGGGEAVMNGRNSNYAVFALLDMSK